MGVKGGGGSYTNLVDCEIRHLDYISGILTSNGGGCYPLDPPPPPRPPLDSLLSHGEIKKMRVMLEIVPGPLMKEVSSL